MKRITIAFHNNNYIRGNQILESFLVMTPQCKGIWGQIEGITDLDKADFRIVMDNVVDSNVDPKRTIYIGNEPYYYPQGFNSFDDINDAFAIVQPARGNTVRPQNWWIGKTYDELMVMEPLKKIKGISTIVSDKAFLPGHYFRLTYLAEWLKRAHLDVYSPWKHPKSSGKYLDEKFYGLRDYRYSITIENGQAVGYFSEKLIDTMLSWTLPIYWGCTNIDDYFPEGSYLLTEDVLETLRIIRDHKINIEALAEARQLILNRYQFWPFIHQLIIDGRLETGAYLDRDSKGRWLFS